jgi:hypothetical protein
MPPLKAADIVAHPAFKHVEWNLPATTSGKVDVAKGRSGGPIGLYYEIHGEGGRRVVVSLFFPWFALVLFGLSTFVFQGGRLGDGTDEVSLLR